MVEKYVADVEVPELTQALEEAQAVAAATSETQEEAQAVAAATSETQEPAESKNDSADPIAEANNARDARAAARANRH